METESGCNKDIAHPLQAPVAMWQRREVLTQVFVDVIQSNTGRLSAGLTTEL